MRNLFLFFGLVATLTLSAATLNYQGVTLTYPDGWELEKTYANGMYQVSISDDDGNAVQLFYNHDAKIGQMSRTDLENMCVFWVEHTRQELESILSLSRYGLEDQYKVSGMSYANRALSYSGTIQGVWRVKGKIYSLFVDDYFLLAYFWIDAEQSPSKLINILKSIKINGKSLSSIN